MPFLFLLAVVLAQAVSSTENSTLRLFRVEGDVQHTHDPSVIKAGKIWYVFSTGSGPDRVGQLPIRCSKDLQLWKHCGYALASIPGWIRKESPGTKDLWAPDVSYFNGEFHVYYAYSLFGKNTSGIALLTNKTLDPSRPDFHWADRGAILRSRSEDDFNAIDPNLVLDAQGRSWLAFGSFWSGIKMRRIDLKTGMLSAEDTRLYSLASRKPPASAPPQPRGLPANWQAIEAPSIVRHGESYYLFVSFDLCCRGTKSTYKTVVGRSRDVTGPYLDARGIPMLEGGGTALLVGNSRWTGPGGGSVFQEKEGDLIVFHAYDAATGQPSLQISTITWRNGWPRAKLEDKAPRRKDP